MSVKGKILVFAISGSLMVTGIYGAIQYSNEYLELSNNLREKKIDRIIANAKIAEDKDFDIYRSLELRDSYLLSTEGSITSDKYFDDMKKYKIDIREALNEVKEYDKVLSKPTSIEKIDEAKDNLINSKNIENLDNVVGEYLLTEENRESEENALYENDKREIAKLEVKHNNEMQSESLNVLNASLLFGAGACLGVGTACKTVFDKAKEYFGNHNDSATQDGPSQE